MYDLDLDSDLDLDDLCSKLCFRGVPRGGNRAA